MSESWRREIPVRQVTETVAKIEAEIAEYIATGRPASQFVTSINEPLSDIELGVLIASAKVISQRPIGRPKGEGYTWYDRCLIRNDNKLRCVYVKGHDYPCKFDVGTGG